MTKQEEVQFKVIALQATAGDIEKAKEVFEWLSEDSIETEVARRQVQIQNNLVKVIDDGQ